MLATTITPFHRAPFTIVLPIGKFPSNRSQVLVWPTRLWKREPNNNKKVIGLRVSNIFEGSENQTMGAFTYTSLEITTAYLIPVLKTVVCSLSFTVVESISGKSSSKNDCCEKENQFHLLRIKSPKKKKQSFFVKSFLPTALG